MQNRLSFRLESVATPEDDAWRASCQPRIARANALGLQPRLLWLATGDAARLEIGAYLEAAAAALTEASGHAGARRADEAVAMIVKALRADRPLLVCGNGGSAADAMHITGELVGRFLRDRRALNCICLVSNPAVMTAWSNDHSFDTVFARQVEAYGRSGGVLIGLSTSGRSPSILRAFEAARAGGLGTIALTGRGGGPLGALADVLIDVPATATPVVQQVHLCLYHYICEHVEAQMSLDT